MRSELPEEFGQLRGNDHNRFALLSELVDDGVDLVLCPHVNAAGGLVEDEQLDVIC